MVYHPAKVYSFSPQIFPTGIEVDESVAAAGSGLKHGRTTTITTCNSFGCFATVNWPGKPFPDTNYTAVCTSEVGAAASISGKTTTSIGVRRKSDNSQDKSFGVDCIAMHD
jgi:hypothetical protein